MGSKLGGLLRALEVTSTRSFSTVTQTPQPPPSTSLRHLQVCWQEGKPPPKPWELGKPLISMPVMTVLINVERLFKVSGSWRLGVKDL